MRKAQKKQIEELLREISEGHKEIKEGINHNTQQTVMDVMPAKSDRIGQYDRSLGR